MEITNVRVYPVDEPKLKGFASIVFDNSFFVGDIKIIQGKEGYFISMPSRRRKDGQFRDIAHPITQEMRKLIETRILEEYQKVTGEEINLRPLTTSNQEEAI